MASPGNHGAAASKQKHLRVLLPFTCDILRIPDELARGIGSEDALIIVPRGRGVVQLVEVGQDGGGAFLGRRWPEFADACGGVGVGWFLVLRHRGGGVLTVKAFDASCCLRELGTPPGVEAAMSRTYASRRPQFISVLRPDSTEKMLIPAKFVQNYILKGHLNSHIVIILGTFDGTYQIELERNQSDMFFAGGWSQFLALHGITEANCLLLRYEGNMTFTVKVFGPNGCQREFKLNDISLQQISTLPDKEKQQEVQSSEGQERLAKYQVCVQNRKSKKDWPISEGRKKPKASITSMNKPPSLKRSYFEIGPPSWISKVINTCRHRCHLPLAVAFCNAIGLPAHSMITLKTSTDSPRSWQVHGLSHKNCSYMLARGWRRFFRESNLKDGDICTFNVIETTLWHVDITRYIEKINQLCYEEVPSASCWNGSASNQEQKKRNGPMSLLSKASPNKRCVFDIGPPSWIKKEMNTSTIENAFSLPLAFCNAIGLRESCMITLKTSMGSTNSWQARMIPYKYCNHLSGLGWKSFCRENRIKDGDACTFNVIETTVWHVVITHCNEKESPESENDGFSEGQKRPTVPVISLSKASSRKHCVFEIGPPAWIKKEINTSTIKNYLTLPLTFCVAIGLWKPCTVTLKTSTSSTGCWKAQVTPYVYHCKVGSGWKWFCHENGVKVGDICTIEVIETTLWHVTIERR